MVRLTKNRPTTSLLTRTRKSTENVDRHLVPADESPPSAQAARHNQSPPNAQAARHDQSPPGTESPSKLRQSGQEVVPFRHELLHPSSISSPSAPYTRSLRSLHQKAEDGDLQARLDILTPSMVEDELTRLHRKDQPDCSILNYLQKPEEGSTRADALAQVLNELADRTEQTSVASAMVWRYAQLHEIWNTHVNPELRTADTFLNSLDQNDLIKINIVIGTSTQVTRRRNIATIEEFWGVDWFQSIPKDLLPPNITSPEGLSKRVLYQMTANCKKKVPLLDAVQAWRSSMTKRLDPGRVPVHGQRTRLTPYLLPDDIAGLNRRPADQQGRRTTDMFFPEIQEDRLEILPLSTTYRPLASRPIPASRGKSTLKQPSTRKRKRQNENDDQRTSIDGKWKLKRVGKHMIREPVVDSNPSTPARQSDDDNLPPGLQQHGTMKCAGLGAANILLRILSTLREYSTSSEGEAGEPALDCCESCSPVLSEAHQAIERHIVPIIDKLKDINHHVASGSVIPISSDDGMSPDKHNHPHSNRRASVSLFVSDNSDSD